MSERKMIYLLAVLHVSLLAEVVPSQMTAECCHQRWFLSAQRVQGMLVIAEAAEVKRVRGKSR